MNITANLVLEIDDGRLLIRNQQTDNLEEDPPDEEFQSMARWAYYGIVDDYLQALVEGTYDQDSTDDTNNQQRYGQADQVEGGGALEGENRAPGIFAPIPTAG